MYPKIHVKSFKTVDAKASELHFATPSAWSWPWGWYRQIPIMSIQRANIFNKTPQSHANSFKTVDFRASKLHIALRWPWGLYHKIPIMSFQRASMLNKIPITHVVRASGQHFPTPPWTWSWPWGWYLKLSLFFFHRDSMLNKIPKINVKSYKTVDVRASGQHFPTPPWIWS